MPDSEVNATFFPSSSILTSFCAAKAVTERLSSIARTSAMLSARFFTFAIIATPFQNIPS